MTTKKTVIIIAGFAVCFILLFLGFEYISNIENKNSQPEPEATVNATMQIPETSLTEITTFFHTTSIPTTIVESSTVDVTLPTAKREIITDTPTTKVEYTGPENETLSSDEANRFKQLLYNLGFIYDPEENIFYAKENTWQKTFGYSQAYDMLAPFTTMVFDTLRFKFDYDNRSWMFQVWKGRYGATTGFEFGIYTKDISMPDNDYWYGVDKDDYILMECNMYRHDKFYFHRGPELLWWLTGFRLADINNPKDLNLEAKFTLHNNTMADAFEESVKKEMESNDTIKYVRDDLRVTVYWGEEIDTIWHHLN